MTVSIDGVLYARTPWGLIRIGDNPTRPKPLPAALKAYRKVEQKPRHIDDSA